MVYPKRELGKLIGVDPNSINKVALGLIENEKTEKKSKSLKKLLSMLKDDYREKIMKL